MASSGRDRIEAAYRCLERSVLRSWAPQEWHVEQIKSDINALKYLRRLAKKGLASA